MIWNAYTIMVPASHDSGNAIYQVLVSENGSELYNFKFEEEFQTPYRQEFSRLKLDKYAGKDIYVAFRNMPAYGNVLCLDNITFYGNFSEVQTGINQTSTNNLHVRVQNGILVCSEVADRLEIYDMTGRVITITKNASSVSIGALPSGAYIARIQSNGQMKTVKFIK